MVRYLHIYLKYKKNQNQIKLLAMTLEKSDLIYIISVVILSLLMIWNIFFSFISFNITFLLFYIVMRFLSSFGLILNISSGFLLLIDEISDKLQKRGVLVLIIVQITLPIILMVYAIYLIFSSYTQGGVITRSGFLYWVDTILFIYGIGSLLLNLYIRPIINEQFHKAVELGKFKWWKKGTKKLARKIKKKYFNLRKEFAKAQIQDQMTVTEILELWQRKFAINFLLVISIGALFFAPLAFVCAAYWSKLYIFYKKDIKKYEKIALVVAMIWIGLVAILSPFLNLPFFLAISNYYWTVNIFYLAGIIISSIIFIRKILILQGITFYAMKFKVKERKIRKLTEEKEELEKKLEEKESQEKISE